MMYKFTETEADLQSMAREGFEIDCVVHMTKCKLSILQVIVNSFQVVVCISGGVCVKHRKNGHVYAQNRKSVHVFVQ